MSSKKGKRKKGTTLNLNEFLHSGSDTGAGKVVSITKKVDSWADAMEDDGAEKVVVLPTAPSSVRGGSHVDPSRVPNYPPFKAFIGNISYDASEDMLRQIFKDLRVVDVHLPLDPGGRFRGYGYVEFETKDDLIEALQMDDLEVCGRKVRVDVKTQSERDQQRAGQAGFTREDDRSDGDWRSGPRLAAGSGGGGGGFSGGRSFGSDRRTFGDESQSSSSTSSRPPSKYKDVPTFAEYSRDQARQGPRYEDRGPRYDDRGPRYDDRGPRYDDRSPRYESRGPRYEDRGPRFDDRGPRYEDSGARFESRGPRYEDRGPRYDDGGARYDDRGPQRGDSDSKRDERWTPPDSRDMSSAKDGGRPSVDADHERGTTERGGSSRPKLNLKPRSVPVDTPSQATSQSSIFGGAKPVDTSAKEREVEERLSKVYLSSERESDRGGERTFASRRADACRDIRLTEPESDSSHNIPDDRTTSNGKTNGSVQKEPVRYSLSRSNNDQADFVEKSCFSALENEVEDS